MPNTDDLRLRQSTWPTYDIDGIPGNTAAEAAASLAPAVADALGSGGTLPDTTGNGTDGAITDSGTITMAASTTPLVGVVTIPAIVVQSPDFSQAVADILAANPTPYLGTPNQPSKPVLSQIPNGILAQWDGYNANGEIEKTPDWDHLEVHVSTDSSFTPSPATLATTIYAPKAGQSGQAVYADTDYGVVKYVRFVAVGRSGASSAPSVPASAVPGQITALDVGRFALTVLNFKDDKHHLY